MKKTIFAALLASSVYCNPMTEEAEASSSTTCEKKHCGDRYFYAEVFSGGNFVPSFTLNGVRTRFRTGYIVSGELGYCWRYGIRLEAEYAYRRNGLKDIGFFGRSFEIDGHYQSSSWMGNLLWELPLKKWGCRCLGIKPLIGGGIGYDDQHIEGGLGILGYNLVKKGFAWQVMAGLAYPLCKRLDISVEYKYHKGRFSHLQNHSVGVGLKYHFYCF